MIGGEGNNTLIGGDGDDDLRDVMFGGAGNDSIAGGFGAASKNDIGKVGGNISVINRVVSRLPVNEVIATATNQKVMTISAENTIISGAT